MTIEQITSSFRLTTKGKKRVIKRRYIAHNARMRFERKKKRREQGGYKTEKKKQKKKKKVVKTNYNEFLIQKSTTL